MMDNISTEEQHRRWGTLFLGLFVVGLMGMLAGCGKEKSAPGKGNTSARSEPANIEKFPELIVGSWQSESKSIQLVFREDQTGDTILFHPETGKKITRSPFTGKVMDTRFTWGFLDKFLTMTPVDGEKADLNMILRLDADELVLRYPDNRVASFKRIKEAPEGQ